MPFYTYKCNQCGLYDEWKKTLSNFNDPSSCPDCGDIGKRVYVPTNILSTSQALRKRVESGAEPKIMKKDDIKGVPRKSPHQNYKRPWQVGH